MAWQMAIAAVAHIFVFSAEPYHYVPASTYGRVTAETAKPAVLEKTEAQVEAPGTSVTKSVQDIVLQGGQCVSLPPTASICHVFFMITCSEFQFS